MLLLVRERLNILLASAKFVHHTRSKCKICVSYKKHSARYSCKFCVVALHGGSCLEEYCCEALVDCL